MAVKKGLGRGLGALMGEENIKDTPKTSGEVMVAISDIDVFTNQPRKFFDEEKLNELAASIRQHGVIQPLILKKVDDRYMIIAGERRFRASRLAGLKEVPAIIKDFDDKQVLEVSIIENIQREDLNPIEEAMAIQMLMKEHDYTQESVADRLGRSRPAVANSLRLLNLPDFAKNYVISGKITSGHARAMVVLKENHLIASVLDDIVAKGLSVRQTEELVKKVSRPAKDKPVAFSPNPFAYAEEKLTRSLETTVKIKGSDVKGKIIIDYNSAEQLEALYEALCNLGS